MVHGDSVMMHFCLGKEALALMLGLAELPSSLSTMDGAGGGLKLPPSREALE